MTVTVTDAQIDVFESDSTNSNDRANYWPMNETRGSTGTDVESGHDLTLKSGVTIDFGTFDNLPTYHFDGGSNSYAAIQTKKFDSSGAISDITVAAWVKPDDTANQKTVISFDSSEYFRLAVLSDEKIQWSTTDSTSTTDNQTSSTTIDDGNWHLIAGVFDSGGVGQGFNEKRIHIDNSTDVSDEPVHGKDNNLGTGTTRFGFIGGASEASSEDGTGGSVPFSGEMSNVFIYDRALSSQELTDIYNAGAVGQPPDFTVPDSDITSVDASQRIDQRRDAGRIVIENNDGSYNADSSEINSGDLLRFRTQLQGETSLSHQWSAMAETILYEKIDYNKSNLRIEATDFVFGIISNRITENSYEGVDIFSIVDDIMSGDAPEIHRDRIQNITDTKDAYPRGTNVLDFLNEMAQKANAVVSNSDRSLVFEKAQQAPFAFTLTDSDKGTHVIRKEGAGIANNIRVDGGINNAIDDQQTTQSSTTTVTESSRITHQLTTRKATVDRVDLYTSDSGSGEDVEVRIQKDDGGSPVAVGDEESDITSKTLSPTDINFVDGGLSTFIFPDHVLPEPNPWMIIESSGSSGQDIGVDGSSNPRYDAYFQFRISTVSGDRGSQDSYRQRDVRIFNGSLRTRDAAKTVAQDKLEHNKEPDQFIEFPAESVRAHNLRTGEIIEVDETNVSGDFIVTDKTVQYSGLNLNTEIEAQLVSTV